MALEHFEDQLLGRTGIAWETVALEYFDLLASMSPEHVKTLRGYLRTRAFVRDEKLIAMDTPATELFLLSRGRVTVSVPHGPGGSHRVGMIDAGNLFGELALFGAAHRTADVIAATDGDVLVLDAEAMGWMREHHPAVFAALSLAVGESLSDRLRRANAEISALSK